MTTVFDQLHNVIASQIPAVSDNTQLPTAGLAGRLYYSVADASMYIDTGSTWSLVATTASEVTAASNFGGVNQLIISSGTAKAVQSSTVTADGSGNLTATIAIVPTVEGATTASANLTLKSTSNATKGFIKFGTSAYDEANNRLGIGLATPSYPLDIVNDGTNSINVSYTDFVPMISNGRGTANEFNFITHRAVTLDFNNGSNFLQFMDNKPADSTVQILSRNNRHLLLGPDGTDTTHGVITRAVASQTALLHDFQNSTPVSVASIDVTGNIIAFKYINTAITSASATNGGTTTLDNTTQLLAVTPATGTVASHTIKLPPSPVNGQRVTISNASATNTITALTINGNGNTIVGSITALNVGTVASYQFITATTTWVPST